MSVLRVIYALAFLILIPSAAFAAADRVLDFTPILQPLIEAVGIVVAVTALPLMWYLINWVRVHLGLQKVKQDDALRRIIDEALQKSLGRGINAAQTAVAGLPMTLPVKNEVLAVAAQYAINTFGDSLKKAQLDQPERLKEALEARLGIMEMQTATGQPSPALPNASQPLAPPTT